MIKYLSKQEGVYHLPSDFQYMEIVDEKTSQVVDEYLSMNYTVSSLTRNPRTEKVKRLNDKRIK